MNGINWKFDQCVSLYNKSHPIYLHNTPFLPQLSEQHGLDTYLHFIRRLIAHSHSQTQRLARDPYLAERSRDGIDKGEGEVFRSFDFIRFVDLLAVPIVSSSTKEFGAQAQVVIEQELAGSLALVTCKEPLKSNFTLHIRQFLAENSFTDIPQNNAVISILVSDNLQFTCTAIEKAAIERAVADVDEGFATAYDITSTRT
ncbi:hypothetical protein F5051DRAFT_447074 [Lentinula edodes]|nr:hypothetical protein F5051DRAFT_447074 [Lentinula edodes]